MFNKYLTYKIKFSIAIVISISIGWIFIVQNQTDESIISSRKHQNTGGKELREFLRMKKGNPDAKMVQQIKRKINKLYDKNIDKTFQKDAGLKSWEWKGPGNIGGRIRAVAVVPNKTNPLKEDIIIGSASGGIWKSVDEGASWNPVNDFMSTLSVSAIAVHPNNPDTIFAATGEYLGFLTAPGAGIFKSVDRGDTWFQLEATNNSSFMWVNEIAIDLFNPKIIFAVTKDEEEMQFDSISFNVTIGVIHKSIDGGTSWTALDSTEAVAFDVKVDPFNSNHILFASWNEMYRSIDGGVNFTAITGGTNQIPYFYDRAELSFAPSLAGIVYASVGSNNGELWRSVDSGVSWEPRDTSSKYLIRQAVWNNTLWVDPLNANRVIAGGVLLSRSTLGGQSMTSIHNSSLHVDIHTIVPSSFYSMSNPKIYLGCDGGIFSQNDIWNSTTNTTWDKLSGGSLGITQFYSGDTDPLGTKYVGGSQDNGGLLGSSTSNWTAPVGGDGIEMIINPVNTNIVYGTSQNNDIYKSTDGGTTFNDFLASFNFQLVCNSNPSFPECPGDTTGSHANGFFKVNDDPIFASPLAMDPDNPDILYTGGNRVWKSSNGGTTWAKVKNKITGGIVVSRVSYVASKSSASLVFVGYTEGELYRSINNGSTWSNDIASTEMPKNFISDIEINPSNSSEVMVAFAGFHNKQIWYSPDSGTTWYNRSPDIPINVNTITWHPSIPGWIYVGTDYGIFASEDYGQNWNITPIYSFGSQTHANDGPVFVEVTDLFWQGLGTINTPYHLCAATYGRGIWRSKFPIVKQVFVDKNCFTCGQGTLAEPYSTLKEAVEKSGSGVEITFLSSNLHNEVPANLLITDRHLITLANGSVIIE